MQSNLDDAGTGAILTGQATNTAWSFAGASSSQSETRQYTDHLNRTVSTATYVAGGRGESTTRYGATAGNRSFTADDVPDHTPDPSSFVAYSSTASEGKGTEYLKRETTFTYDDTQGDEWDEQRNANQLEIYVNTVTVGSDSGILLSAGGGLERFGSTSIEFQSTVHYRQHSDYLGTAFDTQNPSEILWTYDSNRDASFDHTATLTITVYPLVDSLVISYTTSGDTEVNLTGEDDWGRDWEKTELERSLEGVTDITLVGILAENPDAQDAANDTNQQDTSRWVQVGDEGEGDGVGESSDDDPFNGWPDSFKPVTPSNSRVAGLALIAKSRSCLVCHQRGGLVWGGIHSWEQLSPAQQQTIGLWCHPPSARYEAAAIFVGAGTIALGTLAAGEILAVPAALYLFGTQSANSVTSGGFGLAVLEGTLDPSYPGNIATGPKWTSNDPLVAGIANQIEDLYPGLIKCVNQPLYDASGKLVTDADILLLNAVLQIKSGGGKGMASQVLRTEGATNLPVIAFGPTLKGSVIKKLQSQGSLYTRSLEELLEVIRP